jgi:hypothetical protein
MRNGSFKLRVPRVLLPKDKWLTPLLRGKGNQKKGSKKRLTWAALLKQTFKIEVLVCGRCGGPMTLVHIAFGPAEIQTTLIALGLSPRAPPIAPARQTGVFGSIDDGPAEAWSSDQLTMHGLGAFKRACKLKRPVRGRQSIAKNAPKTQESHQKPTRSTR